MSKEESNFVVYFNKCKTIANIKGINIEEHESYFKECYDARLTEEKALIHYSDVVNR